VVSTIHRTAIVSNGAQIHETVEIGPYAVIGPDVVIGKKTKIGAHTVIDGHTTIGDDCNIYASASIGLDPQDLSYQGQPTGVVIGNRVTIREFATVHRASKEERTVIGDDCFLMNYSHVAHDCRIGNGVIMANGCTFAGHVTVGDYSVFAGITVFHQFVRVGRMVIVSGMTGTRLDLPPFTMCDLRPLTVRGLNLIGMRRQKVPPEVRSAIKEAYRLLYRSGLNISQAIAQIAETVPKFPEIDEIVEFFQSSKRGVIGLVPETEETNSF
jgi:UDP-N-acetylglucosamine acyltransferase